MVCALNMVACICRLYVCKRIEGRQYLLADLRVTCDTSKYTDYT